MSIHKEIHLKYAYADVHSTDEHFRSREPLVPLPA
jgi:hypothetical protein